MQVRHLCGGGQYVNEILSKISSYNIFNYLVPGALFVIAAKRVNIIDLDDADLATKLLIFYIVGMIISRLGSLLIEPGMRWAKLVRYSDYKNYVLACAKDNKIEILVEVNNTYRTFAAAFMALSVGMIITARHRDWSASEPWIALSTLAALIVLFLLSFIKQANYVRNRVEAHTVA
jgi:hypothetical protein